LERFLGFIALLSVNLGLLNLFPFPPFDGGHAVVYVVEMIRMKPLTMKQMETFGKIGFALIIPLFIFLIFNDLARTDCFPGLKD
jgi:regulator of sigma E protease